jgi:hypothetical protein
MFSKTEKMKKFIPFLLLAALTTSFTFALTPKTQLVPFSYKENFESNELNAWASYPLWQDTAFDPNLRPSTIIPGDPNVSLIQKVTPYSNVDNYAGAQKKLEMYLAPDSSVSLRYYLKTQIEPAFFKVRLAAGFDGKVDFTVSHPPANRWENLRVRYEDFVKENTGLKGKIIKVNALAVLAKFPKADPSMPIYLGLDDVIIEGAAEAQFEFIEPKVSKLSEWKPCIPQNSYQKGDFLVLRGRWPFEPSQTELEVFNFVDRSKTLLSKKLKKRGNEWCVDNIKLSFPEGLYLAILTGYEGKAKVAETEFTIHVTPRNIRNNHPRLWFDHENLAWLKKRIQEERFKNVAEEISNAAKEIREKSPIDKIVFDIDQFPVDESLIGNVPRSIYPWFDRINAWKSGLYQNSFAFALLDNKSAGEYAKSLLLKLSEFPFLVHPWFEKRGQHIYYPVGELAMDMALSYDLLYSRMSESERKSVRQGFLRNVISGCHKSYVEDDLVTSNTSNWVAHITSGSIMCQAAIYDDGEDVEKSEAYFTGVILKLHDFIRKSSGRDGGYGESYGYSNFTMSSLSQALPAIENVFKIDFSPNLRRSYLDLLWAGLIKEKLFFHFGDTGGNLGPLTNWAWLLPKYKDTELSWLYHFLKQGETLMDILYKTEEVPKKEPFSLNPVRSFWDLGTTVFKSGWEKDDFVFVMRTGAFYNHQHLDQGTFWLADRGTIFIEERHGSTYYDDPFYQSHYTQPVAHSTILIDHNPQSQRTGDPLLFAEGFEDRAFIYHFLDGEAAAFSSGDIGRLYWGKVKEMRRNVLYLKPRTLLMLDTIIPNEEDIDVTLLYQTARLDDIQPGKEYSTITKGNNRLYIYHLSPEKHELEALETPHYILTLKNEKPLWKEGMLTVTGRTQKKPLVMANLFVSSSGEEIKIEYQKGEGCARGKIQGKEFAFSLNPGQVYRLTPVSTDALAITWDKTKIFAALCTTVEKEGKILIHSEEPITCEMSKDQVKYYLAERATVAFGLDSKPEKVLIKGEKTDTFTYDKAKKILVLNLPAGEGLVEFRTDKTRAVKFL